MNRNQVWNHYKESQDYSDLISSFQNKSLSEIGFKKKIDKNIQLLYKPESFKSVLTLSEYECLQDLIYEVEAKRISLIKQMTTPVKNHEPYIKRSSKL